MLFLDSLAFTHITLQLYFLASIMRFGNNSFSMVINTTGAQVLMNLFKTVLKSSGATATYN